MSFAKTLATLQVANYTGLGALSIPTARTCWVCHNAHFPCQNYIKKTNDDRNGRNDRNDIYQWYTVDLETESDLQQEHPAKSWGYRPQSWRSTPNTQPWCWSRCMDWRQRQTRSPHENIGSINAHWCPPIISNNPVDLQWDTPAQWLLSCLIFFLCIQVLLVPMG